MRARGSGRAAFSPPAGSALALALAVAPLGAAEIPFLAGRVNDYADLIDGAAEERIEGRLAELEARRGAQIVVLTVTTLAGEPVEDYSLAVAETWGLGREAADDGVLFLIARDDRKMRIEVGYGLEAELTDAEAGRILRNAVGPRFQSGDFSGGVEAGVEAIVGTLDGTFEVERLAGPEEGRGLSQVGVIGLLFAVVFSLPALMARGLGSWILFLFLAPFWGAVAANLLGPRYGYWGLVAWVGLFLLVRLALATPVGRRWTDSGGGWSSWGGGSDGGWGGGGGFSGGGFSGGGFSGGGGSFGGGGASGSW